MNQCETWAQTLDDAARTATAVPQISASQALSLEEAYEVQRLSIDRRIGRGQRLIGVKMGFTSRAKMVQMGVSDVIWGRLTDEMQLDDAGAVDLTRYVHPRVEPEVAFVLKKPLAGRVTLAQAMAAVDAVAPAIELIDSRYERFRFSLSDVIADNASSAGFVLGPSSRPEADIDNLGVIVEIGSRVARVGSTAAILGNPWRALIAAAAQCGAAGEPLQPGWIVLAGGATEAEPLSPGTHVKVTVQKLGSVSLHAQDRGGSHADR